jgi:putative ABC transport system permease protein
LLADNTEAATGLGLGRVVRVEPGRMSLRVTGVASGIRYDGLITAWSTLASWERAVRLADPGGTIMPNALAVRATAGTPAAMLARELAAALPGTQVLTRAEAVADVPGASVISATFDLLIAAAFLAVVLIVGSVFLLITAQRSRAWALLRALGSSAGLLSGVVLIQAALVVIAAGLLASFALMVVSALSGTAFPVRAAPSVELWTMAATLTGACLSSVLPMRRIGRLDPATAMARS